MELTFVATYIYASMEDDYYLLGFSDKERDFTEYIMIQLAYEFDEQDISLGEDGEYFEYADKDNMDARYKCVEKVLLTPTSITFSLNQSMKNNIEHIKIDFLDVTLSDTALEYLNIIFKNRLIKL